MARHPWLLDTNILLRFFPVARTSYPEVERAVNSLLLQEQRMVYTSQNVSEFWNVCTRPLAVNGLGLSIAETDHLVRQIEDTCYLAPDSEAVHTEWRRLIVSHQVSGAQVHDARIVATMRVNEITRLLTLNVKDFRRYPNINSITPQELLSKAT